VLSDLRAYVEHPNRQRILRRLWQGSAFAVLALFAFGTVMVATMVRGWIVALAVLTAAAWPWLLGAPASRHRAVQAVAVAPGAVLVPVTALLGVDVLWSWARLPRPSAAVGLAIAALVVCAVAYAYLRWVGKPTVPHHGLWSAAAGLAAIGLAALTGQTLIGPLWLAAAATVVATWMYLGRAAGPDIRRPLWWALLLVAVTVVAAPLLAESIQGGRTSPILLVTGASLFAVAGLNGAWLRRGSAARKEARLVLVFGVALPLLMWVVVHVTSTAPDEPHEVPLPAVASAGPLPHAAVDHRPILLFDANERFRTPLDVDRMLASGDVRLCPQGNGLLADCRNIERPADLRNGFGNLRFDTQTIQDDDLPTTIYARTVPDRLNTGWTDIDYWWYLPDNPANTAKGAMCGAGFVIPEITCFDHQSDWEGVTVVVDHDVKPVAVHYAAHKNVIAVPWKTLETAVKRAPLARYAAGRDVTNRPLVFVALGTHAAYPLPCRASPCDAHSVLEDNSHDGGHEWPEDHPCAAGGCVSPFPVTGDGGVASWNAFDGYWGSAACVAKVYCARSNAPRAPGRQNRYKCPWRYDLVVVAGDLRHPRPVKPPPPKCAA
jgi:hypothetical protein